MLQLARIEKPAAAAVLIACMLMSSPAAAQSPFSNLQGSWSGGGRIVLEGGNTERLTCRANYNPRAGGGSLGMSIRCSSSSYSIDLRASLESSGGRISGSWEERTFNASGSVSGRGTPTALNLSFNGNVNGSMALSVGGRSQRVSITSNGGGFRSVSMSLSKG